MRRPPRSTLFPYTTPSGSELLAGAASVVRRHVRASVRLVEIDVAHTDPRRLLGRHPDVVGLFRLGGVVGGDVARSEEHTSELQSRQYVVCRLLLEKKQDNH